MVKVECPACKGAGTIPRPALKPWSSPYLGANPSAYPLLCERCNGSGILKLAKPPDYAGS